MQPAFLTVTGASLAPPPANATTTPLLVSHTPFHPAIIAANHESADVQLGTVPEHGASTNHPPHNHLARWAPSKRGRGTYRKARRMSPSKVPAAMDVISLPCKYLQDAARKGGPCAVAV